MDKTEELILTLKEGKWNHGEALWLDILETGITDVEPLRKAAKIMWNRGQRKLTLELLDLTAATCCDNKQDGYRLETLRILAEYNPIYKGLIPNFADAFKNFYRDRKHLSSWIDRILQKKLSTTQFLKTLDRLAMFHEGMFVEHQSGWGIGQVKQICEEKMEIIVDLEHRPDNRMDALGASDCLRALSPDDLDVLLKFQPDLLKIESAEDPIKLIGRVLRHCEETLNTQKIKHYLCPAIIEKEKWNSWWTKTRKQLIAAPYIEVTPGPHARYSLREKAVSWEDEVRKQFDESEILNKPRVILDYLKNTSEKTQLDYFAQALSELAFENFRQGKPSHALECYLVLQACIENGAKVESLLDIKTILGKDPLLVYTNLRLVGLAQRSLKIVLEYTPSWEEQMEQVFKKGTDLARDTLFRHIMHDSRLHERILLIIKEIMNSRLSYPEAYIWASKQIVQERIPDKHKLFDLVETFVEMIETGGTFKAIGQSEKAKKLSRLFTPALASKICKLIDAERAHRIFNILIKNTWLPSTFWKSLKEEIQDRYPKLFTKVKPIYTSKTGLDKYERELQDLLQNKIPENTRAIGHALSFGDLSENAELDAAREIQWQLTQKAQEMRNNIARASIIDFETLGNDKVEIGTRVILKNGQDEKIKYSIVGPWDVDMERGFISFMSQIAITLLGVGRNEKVSLPAGDYTIVSIEKCREEDFIETDH